MDSYDHINSIEVAVLCLMQKIMNKHDVWSSKMSRDSCQGKYIQVFTPKISIILYGAHNLFTPSFLVPMAPPPKITKY